MGGFAAIVALVAVLAGANPALIAAPGPCAAFAYILATLRPEPDDTDLDEDDAPAGVSNVSILVIGCLFLVVATLAVTYLDESFSLLTLALSVVVFGAAVVYGRR